MTKILVIEDEAMLGNEISEWLSLEGYEAFGAADGIEGVQAAFQHQPDLIICDITMPRLDGHGVLLELRANPTTASIPFIFVTARAAYEDVRKGMELGADDYITKPFSRLELLQAIRIRLEKSALQEQHHRAQVDQWQSAFQAEHEQRQLKSKLVAMFSHDFRNPLASIRSSVSLLRDYSDRMNEERRLTHFNRIDASINQLLQMLDDMLFVSQMETGQLEFKPEPLNIAELMQGLAQEFQFIHEETHRIVFESSYGDTIRADPRLLRQIGANLLSNAIKYSPQGGEVDVILERDDGQVVLTVRDHGIGVPDADQPHLFTAFHRASNVSAISGTGLGLVIVKQAVDLLSGKIDFESQVGVGTTVTVRIPL